MYNYQQLIQQTRTQLCQDILKNRLYSNEDLNYHPSLVDERIRDEMELYDIRVPLYLHIYHQRDSTYTLLERWRIVFESDPYQGNIKSNDKIFIQQLQVCVRGVNSYAVSMPSHRLIKQKKKLNQNFVIEYKLSDKFEKNDFNDTLVIERKLISLMTVEGRFSCSVAYISNLSKLSQKRSTLIAITTNDYSSRHRPQRLSREKSKYHKSVDPPSPLESNDKNDQIERGEILTPRVNHSQEKINIERLKRSYTLPVFFPMDQDNDDIFTLETPPHSSFNSSNKFNPFRESPSIKESSSYLYNDIHASSDDTSKGIHNSFSSEGETERIIPSHLKETLSQVVLENIGQLINGSD